MPVCSTCGRSVDRGYTIIRNRILCAECSEQLESLMEECELQCRLSDDYKQCLQNFVKNKKEEIEKFVSATTFALSVIRRLQR